MRKEVSLILDSLTEAAEDDFVFVSEMRYKDYVIEFFKGTQDGKYYWQAEYDGEDRKLSNFNIWVTARGISLYSEDEKGYLTKEDVVSKAKEWIDKQKRKWNDSLTEAAETYIETGRGNPWADSVKEEVSYILPDSGFNANAELIDDNRYNTTWSYFGDCITTVDGCGDGECEVVWDATQMAGVIAESYIYLGEKKLINAPKEAHSRNVICGVYKRELIGIIYNVDNDMHYFFDIDNLENNIEVDKKEVRAWKFDSLTEAVIEEERILAGGNKMKKERDIQRLEKITELLYEALDILYDIEDPDEIFNSHQALEVIDTYSSINASLDELLSDLSAYFEELAFIHREE